jgi:hypothetical protein
MKEIKSILKQCMVSVMRHEPFPSEADFMAHLAMELKKEKLSVIVEYNSLNLYLDNDAEYKKIASQLNPRNKLPVIDIVIEHEGNIYPIELKYTFFNAGKTEFGSDATTNIKGFIADIEIIKSIKKINTGYCIFLNNTKDFINEKIQALNEEDTLLIKGYEWVDADNPYDYACLFKEIVRP